MRFLPGRVESEGKALPKEAVLLTDGECHPRSIWLALPVPVSSSTKQTCMVDQGFPQKTNAPEHQARRKADPLELDASVLSVNLCRLRSLEESTAEKKKRWRIHSKVCYSYKARCGSTYQNP